LASKFKSTVCVLYSRVQEVESKVGTILRGADGGALATGFGLVPSICGTVRVSRMLCTQGRVSEFFCDIFWSNRPPYLLFEGHQRGLLSVTSKRRKTCRVHYKISPRRKTSKNDNTLELQVQSVPQTLEVKSQLEARAYTDEKRSKAAGRGAKTALKLSFQDAVQLAIEIERFFFLDCNSHCTKNTDAT